MLSDMDINAIAGTLKLYFRELPEPLLTDRLYPAFMEGIGEVSGVLRVSWANCCIPANSLSSALSVVVAEGPESEVLPAGLGAKVDSCSPVPLPVCPLCGSSLNTDLLPRNTGT